MSGHHRVELAFSAVAVVLVGHAAGPALALSFALAVGHLVGQEVVLAFVARRASCTAEAIRGQWSSALRPGAAVIRVAALRPGAALRPVASVVVVVVVVVVVRRHSASEIDADIGPRH